MMYCRNYQRCQVLIRNTIGDITAPAHGQLLHLQNTNRLNSRNRFASTSSSSAGTGTTVNKDEIEKFNRIASDWWNPEGEFKALHSMNTLRVAMIRDGLCRNSQTGSKSLDFEFPLAGLRILDIGCGGGILSQPLGRIGAQVTGLDPGKENIVMANSQLPAELKCRVQFVNSTLEDFARDNPEIQFDGIVASEVLEHVLDTKLFLQVATQLVKPLGSLFLTTINRTSLSWMGAIVAGEYLLRLLPRGTHEWKNFVTPEDLQKQLLANGCQIRLVHGMMYNPWNNSWKWSRCTDINYAIHAVKDAC